MTYGTVESISELEAGLAFDEMIGDGIDPRVATAASFGVGVINAALIAKLYGVAESAVVFTESPPAFAWKATIERRIPSGAVGDTDVYGAQQHAPLLDVQIPL